MQSNFSIDSDSIDSDEREVINSQIKFKKVELAFKDKVFRPSESTLLRPIDQQKLDKF
jgi:hypothetical protein